ncbi:PEP-CTERM sorting domain-containing protein [Gloeocapsa sp. PCC 73106]|uniref:PEP-CTERM sorting domain-containing protein n=1 Tax=Gloeocapsa sp. PCC 73106 TaxID=102232 RepID=UPI0002ACEA28|nr:PEP-CTERM sorting domain-containing protein [Gloeocapsa sp. PCC 73106]ELR97555.1 PEP-CTERM putative exosortase interaction domain-containing protein [Gloeocapsa sp. PCC 73106]
MKLNPLISCLGMAASFVLVANSAAQGASLSLVPNGTQLDTDPINDRVTNANDLIDFTFRLDTSGLTANLTSLDFSVVRDPLELELLSLDNAGSQAVFPELEIIEIDLSDPRAEIRGAVLSGPVGVAPDTVVDLFTTSYRVGTLLANDGLEDLRIIEITSAIDANGEDVIGSFELIGDVEVQPIPEPTTLLGTALIFGLGALVKKKN